MQKYINSVAGTTGAPVGGASVQVNVYPGGTPATIYSDNGITQASNPLTTDLANGSFSFYAPDGHYQLVVTGSNIQPITLNDVLLVDAIPSDQAVASSVNSADILSIQQGGTLKQATGSLIASMVLGADSPIPVANGGTGATTAAGARSNLGAAASGVNSDITSLTGLTTPITVAEGGTGSSTAAGARTNLGLGSMATQNANSVAITGGTMSGVTLSDLSPTTGAALVGANDGASGSLWTTVAGFIAKIISNAGSSVVGFIQAGTGAVSRYVQDRLRETVSVKDFGAKGDGSTDDYAAIIAARNYARSIGGALHFPPVPTSYAFGTPLDFGSSFDEVTFGGPVTLKYIGGAVNAAITFDAGSTLGSGVYGGSFGWGCPPKIQASTASYACYVRGWHHGRLDFRCTAAINAALRVDFAVCSEFRWAASSNEAAFVTRPINGMQINQRNAGEATTDCTFYNAIAEGVSGDGWVLNNAQNCTFLGGTSEGNGGAGVTEGSSCAGNTYIDVFCEANTNRDFYLAGYGAVLHNCNGGSNNQGLQVVGNRVHVLGGNYKVLLINAGADGTVLDNVPFYDTANSGALIDNGTNTVYRKVHAQTAAGFVNVPEKTQKPKTKKVGGMSITGATQAAKCVLTIAGHNLDWGESIAIAAVGGMTQLNGNTYTAEVIDANTVYILSGGAYVNSTGYSAYTSGGTATFVALQNSWAQAGGSYKTAGFSRSADGYVQMTGAMTGGTLGAVAFTLPSGYRPGGDVSFAVANMSGPSTSYVSISASTGGVTINGANNTHLALDACRFLAEQ